MIDLAKFKQLQKLFWAKVTEGNNPAKVVLEVIGTVGGNAYSNFTGDNKRAVTETVALSCFYTTAPSEKQREKAGVSVETSTIVYVSPIELKAKYGFVKFPEHIMEGLSNIRAVFNGKHYEVLQIREMELMFVNNEYVCLAYMIALGKDTGNYDFN